MNDNGKRQEGQVTPISITVKHEQKAALLQVKKDMGMISLSEAARYALDRWLKFEARESGVKVES